MNLKNQKNWAFFDPSRPKTTENGSGYQWSATGPILSFCIFSGPKFTILSWRSTSTLTKTVFGTFSDSFSLALNKSGSIPSEKIWTGPEKSLKLQIQPTWLGQRELKNQNGKKKSKKKVLNRLLRILWKVNTNKRMYHTFAPNISKFNLDWPIKIGSQFCSKIVPCTLL